ncbi:glycosyltransferase family 2 protein [Rhizobium acaciae]|uniref:glycosyltransferase family 2 protein n=1 Tax=Rhizobium acaciae TaxID=2989736 RepID=UPI003F99164C
MKPLISVVIPTYNRQDYILESIKTVLDQTYDRVEILVVDDCSTDDTLNVLKTVVDERLRVLQLPRNSGGGAARNFGIDAAKGEYIAFLDSDDVWLPKKLEVQLERLLATPNQAVIVYTNLIEDRGDTKTTVINSPKKPDQNVCEYLFLNWGKSFIQTSSWLMPTDVARTVRFDDDLRIHQDWDFLIRAEILGYGLLAIEDPLTVWRIDDRKDRVSLASDRLERSLTWIKKWERHIGWRGVSAIKAWRSVDIASNNLPKALIWVLFGVLARGVPSENAIWMARRCWWLKKRAWRMAAS